MQLRRLIRVEGQFRVHALFEIYEDKHCGTVLGYYIEGPGAEPDRLYGPEEADAKLEELKSAE